MMRNEKGISLICLVILIGGISIILIGATVYTVIFKGTIKVTQNNIVYDEYYLRELIDKGKKYNNYSCSYEYNGEVVSYARNGHKFFYKGNFDGVELNIYYDEDSQKGTVLSDDVKMAYIYDLTDDPSYFENNNIASNILDNTIDTWNYKYSGKKNIDGYKSIGYTGNLTNELLDELPENILKKYVSYKDLKAIITLWLEEESGLLVQMDMEFNYKNKVEKQKVSCNLKKDCVTESQVTAPDLSGYEIVK